jgi:hypothetical protein
MNIPVQQTPALSLNMFAPKPFRSTASINLDTQNNNETVRFSLLITKKIFYENRAAHFVTFDA